jgi:predicted transcriptional regulator
MADETDVLITLTADIVAAHVRHNNVAVTDVPILIQKVHDCLAGLGGTTDTPEATPGPAVPIRASVKPGHIVCLEDGKECTVLTRHLMTHHGLTPDEYRAKWGLRYDYPMSAPTYTKLRRALAIENGLGRARRKRNK